MGAERRDASAARGEDRLYPLDRVYARIRYGCEFDIGTFYQMAVWTADQTPFQAERIVNIELVENEYHEQNVLYEDVERLLLAVVNGEEEYMILSSADGFLQFFGMNDKFVAETRVNLPDGDFLTYSIINEEKKHVMEKITVRTMLSESKISNLKFHNLRRQQFLQFLTHLITLLYHSLKQFYICLRCHIDNGSSVSVSGT